MLSKMMQPEDSPIQLPIKSRITCTHKARKSRERAGAKSKTKSREQSTEKQGTEKPQAAPRTNSLNSNWDKFRDVVNKQKPTKNKKGNSQHRTQGEKPQGSEPKVPRIQAPAKRAEQKTKQPEDTTEEKQLLTKEIAVDCEMVGIGDGTESMLARVSLVNRFGTCIYDKYVKPREEIKDYRTAVSGIQPHHVANGESFEVVQKEVSNILRGRVLVGHALKHDLAVLFLSHPHKHKRDTSHWKFFKEVTSGRTPSLKKLAAALLGIDIQSGEHNSIEDARTAMQLYVLYRKKWEREGHFC